MYVCIVCNHTFHWSCLLRLGCYKDEDGKLLKKENWACPACACLTDSEKELRHHFAKNEELKVVTWDPTWIFGKVASITRGGTLASRAWQENLR